MNASKPTDSSLTHDLRYLATAASRLVIVKVIFLLESEGLPYNNKSAIFEKLNNLDGFGICGNYRRNRFGANRACGWGGSSRRKFLLGTC